MRALAAVAVAVLALAGCDPQEAPAAPDDSPDAPVAEPGVSDDPCPEAVNPGNGCVYLGTISVLSDGSPGDHAAGLAQGQAAFWARVNEAGGIDGYDVDVTTHVVDGGGEPSAHVDAYEEIASEILALAQIVGADTAAAIRDRMSADVVLGVPASSHSRHAWNEMLLSSGASSCVQAMNAVDVGIEEFSAASVLAVHDPGGAGEDAAAGARIAAEAHDIPYDAHEVTPDQDAVNRVVDEVVTADPGIVVVAAGPLETAALVARAAGRGYTGAFIGTADSFHPDVLDNAAAEPLTALYLLTLPWADWDADTRGHAAMREWLGHLDGDVTPDPAHVAGWATQYPVLGALEHASAEGRLTRHGLREAARSLPELDYEGMAPPDLIRSPGTVGHRVARQVVLAQPDPGAETGLRVTRDFFAGPTADAHGFREPCA